MAYWDVARQQSLTNLRIINLERSQELLRIATAKHQLGATSLLDVRQAELDRNADSSAILRQNLAFRQAERTLNSLLERDLELEFRVDSLAFLDTTLSLSILRTSLEENNPNLHAARFNEQSFEASIRLAKSSWYPNVAVYSKFTALNTIPDETPPSLLYSPSALWGVQLDWKLYEGGRTRVRVASAQESREFARYTTQQVRANLEKTLALSWANYQQSVQMWQMELRNASLADQTFQLALEQFKLGAISALEMRRLQESYTEAVSRATMARFDAKQAEIAVMALVGQ
jgi:outer membrane protein TolC